MSTAKIRFLIIVIVPAAVLMALEIVSSRLLAPVFGNSVYVWGSIISVFLAAMSVGYFWGGSLADRDAGLPRLGEVLLTGAFFQALILIGGEQAVAAVGSWVGNGPLGILVASVVIFAPPTVPLAMVSPFVIRIAAEDLQELGSTAGRLYALSTAGSLAGTLGATFVLIPNLPIRPIFSLLLAATSLCALSLVWLGNPRRQTRIFLAASLLLLAILPEDLIHRTEINVLTQRMTAYQSLKVTEIDGIRYLYSDGALHGAVDTATGEPRIPYALETQVAYLFQPNIERVALIGVGSGSVGNLLLKTDPGLVIDQVDIDGAVNELAVDYFQARSDEQSRMHVADGRQFLERNSPQTWDFIYLDTYIGHSIPFHLSTVEFFELIESRLRPGGVVGLNFAGSIQSPLSRGLLRTMGEVFPFVYVFGVTGGNYHFVGTSKGPRFDRQELIERGRQIDQRLTFPAAVEELAKNLQSLDLELTEDDLLEDRFAPVNHLSRD